MKIALVSPYDYAYPGGVTSHVAHLAEQFTAKGHDVCVIAPSSRLLLPTNKIIVVGKPVSISASGSVARISISLRQGGVVKNILRQQDFDVVHLHEPLMPTLPIMFLRFSKALNVGTFHASHTKSRPYYWGRRLLKRWFHKLDGKVAVSRPAMDFVNQYFPDHYTIIPNGVDVKRFSQELAPLERFRDGKLNILFVGRWEKRKGLDNLLRAFAHIQRDFPHIRLLVVGPEGSQGETYRWYAKRMGLKDVVFSGFVPFEELLRYYQAADIFCAPATGGESFGIVLLEAMAAGKPIVASNIPGYASVVTQGVEGLLVPPKDEDALVGALARLVSSAELRQEMAARGRLTVQNYDWPRIADRVLSYYEGLLVGEMPRRPPSPSP